MRGASSKRFVRVGRSAELGDAIDQLGIRRDRPVLVLVGGAAGVTAEELLAVDLMLRETVVPLLSELDAAVVYGATDSGVMRAVGRARFAADARFPLVGVAATGTVAAPGMGAEPLDPHHTHLILVPGQTWGDESPWLAAAAEAIARDRPSVTLVINGGAITYADIDASLLADRPVVVVAGTGRAADEIAAAAAGLPADPRAALAAAAPLTRIVDLALPAVVARTIESFLAGRTT
ncbi:hypothetical protein [Alloactinosynnema sp. L-07]|uniref:hypothetical protein n=1 Tax=Alloactinosynnema sp. L-07 TaxID=1653480 RepID=UPI00065EFAF1|nr:hypothetical protein [Alloactinosynnema sp. L-07]CRK59116.1 hypothetical protein [Alloactinosynnema sp. L-07]